MKGLLIVAVLFFFINQVTCLTVSKLEGLEDHIERINLDSDGNIYVAGSSSGITHIYKFSASKELLWKVNLPSYVILVEHIHITSERDIYLHLVDNKNAGFFAILKNGSTTIESIEPIKYNFFFVDGYDNLFYTTENGMSTFRHNSNDSVLIKNLENVKLLDNSQIFRDRSGNLYTGVGNYAAVITQKSLQEEIPSAHLYQLSEDEDESANHFYFDLLYNIWITLANPANLKGAVQKFENGTLKTIVTDKLHWNLNLVLAKDKVFVIAADFLDRVNSSDIYYITEENKIVEISELKNITFDFRSTNGLADDDGNAYFYTAEEFSPSLGSMILVKHDEMKPVPIEFEFSNGEIIFVKWDLGDLWIGTSEQGLHYLKKGEVVAEKVDIPEDCNDYLRVFQAVLANPFAKETYVGCQDGLYVVVKN